MGWLFGLGLVVVALMTVGNGCFGLCGVHLDRCDAKGREGHGLCNADAAEENVSPSGINVGKAEVR